MYAKIFGQILDSSIARDSGMRRMFQDMLILASAEGEVDMTFFAIAQRLVVSEDEVCREIAKLEQPDPDSRTTDCEGRRLVRLNPARSWGWRIVNYPLYRKIVDEEERKLRNRGEAQKYRDKKKAVSSRQQSSAVVSSRQQKSAQEEEEEDVDTATSTTLSIASTGQKAKCSSTQPTSSSGSTQDDTSDCHSPTAGHTSDSSQKGFDHDTHNGRRADGALQARDPHVPSPSQNAPVVLQSTALQKTGNGSTAVHRVPALTATVSGPAASLPPHEDMNQWTAPTTTNAATKLADQPVTATEGHPFMLAWNQLTGPPFPKLLSMNKKRETDFRLRMKEPFFAENWKEALTLMKDRPFLRGETERGWVANPDFFLRTGSVTKIMEGQYSGVLNGSFARAPTASAAFRSPTCAAEVAAACANVISGEDFLAQAAGGNHDPPFADSDVPY